MLRLIRAKGVVPLPGVKTKAHADEIVGCLGWQLVQEDVDILEAAHDVSSVTLSTNWPLRDPTYHVESSKFESEAYNDIPCASLRLDLLVVYHRARGPFVIVGSHQHRQARRQTSSAVLPAR